VLGPLTLAGQSRTAVFVHPPASCVYALDAPFAGRCRIAVGLLPEAAQGHPAGITVSITAARASGPGRTVRRRLTPAMAGRWMPVALPFPAPRGEGDHRLQLTVTTAVADGGTSAWAWTVTSTPEIDRPRTLTEVLTAARVMVDTARRDGWRRALRQVARGPRHDRDDVDYAAWLRRQPAEDDAATQRAAQRLWPDRPLVSVITPVFNTRPDWLRACYQSLVDQSYATWQWCVCDDASGDPETVAALAELAADPRVRVTRLDANGGISRASNAALGLATGDLIVLLDHDDALTPDALHHIVQAFVSGAALELLYSDEDKLEIDGSRTEPYFKPDWSPELFLSTMYACHATAARRTLVARAGGFREGFEGAQDYDLWLRMIELSPRVHHIRRVLYHWRKVPGSTSAAQEAKPWASDAGQRALASAVARRGLSAAVEPGATAGRYRIRHTPPPDLTSILIPTYGAATATAAHTRVVVTMLRSLSATLAGRAVELICATDDGTLPAEVRAAATAGPVITVAAPGPFNFSARVNAAAARASGRFLLILNDDIEALEPGWLDALMEYAQQPEIGAVGARLEFPDGRLQHTGLLLGVRGIAAHAFHEAPGDTPGYFGSVISPRNVSAVTAACLATRREVFTQLGGFDEQLPVDFNDVDYCLKAQAAGLRVVYTPYARLRHHEGASLGGRRPGADAQTRMQDRWGARLRDDPFYHPALSRDAVNYVLR
jgi:GT2 family glycosyltransferase